MQVEFAAVNPGMPGEHVSTDEIKVIFDSSTCLAKQAFENPVHGENGGPRIDRRIADADRAQLAAGAVGFVKDRDRIAAAGEIRGSSESAHASADDDDVRLGHDRAGAAQPAEARRPPVAWIRPRSTCKR